MCICRMSLSPSWLISTADKWSKGGRKNMWAKEQNEWESSDRAAQVTHHRKWDSSGTASSRLCTSAKWIGHHWLRCEQIRRVWRRDDDCQKAGTGAFLLRNNSLSVEESLCLCSPRFGERTTQTTYIVFEDRRCSQRYHKASDSSAADKKSLIMYLGTPAEAEEDFLLRYQQQFTRL